MTTPATTSALARRQSALWSDRSRERAHRLDSRLLDEARRNSAAVAHDVGFLFMLAMEIARVRGSELARAYPALVAAMAGFKNTRERRGRPAQAAALPCVVLVVRRKRAMPGDHPGRLPAWLITYADHGGRRLPFAVMTDVQDASEHRGLRPHSNSELWTQRPGFDRNYGHFSALVQVEGKPSTYLLSAMHVLSPDQDEAAPQAFQLDVLPVDASGHALPRPRLATGHRYGGRLMPDPGNGAIVSLDVQLALLDASQVDELMAVCPLRALDPAHATAEDPTDLARMAGQSNRFELLRADNNQFGCPAGTVELMLSAAPTDGDLPYDFAQGAIQEAPLVHQLGLLRFDAIDPNAVPRPGDSGSAIVFRDQATGLLTLVAMHIAGDGQGASLAIPAWTLFDISAWNHPPPGALTLVQPT
jgi:hypothetical protein